MVVPTSTSLLPLCSITEGTLNDPPISTSSPLETITSLFLAKVDSISKTAAALLLTTTASSAPVSLHNISLR